MEILYCSECGRGMYVLISGMCRDCYYRRISTKQPQAPSALRAALSSCRRLVKDKRFSEAEKLKNIGRIANEHAPDSPLRTIPTKDPDHE